LSDSVLPDIEAYGRDMIARYFQDERGPEYLLKLSQHPTVNMQLFASNLLERFAADRFDRLASLQYYFRSVLTRVNRGSVVKRRVYSFLSAEGMKSEEAAAFVCSILSDVSATSLISEKARCIEIMLRIKSVYEVKIPVIQREFETRSSN